MAVITRQRVRSRRRRCQPAQPSQTASQPDRHSQPASQPARPARQTDRQTDRQTGRQTDTQADRQTTRARKRPAAAAAGWPVTTTAARDGQPSFRTLGAYDRWWCAPTVSSFGGGEFDGRTVDWPHLHAV